jgi:predicted O-linked N-acetylglucosamine transferase (SPINDLY family)
MIPLLSYHDHERFEIFCYSSALRPDALTERIAGYADVFRNVAALNDAELAKVIHEDRIDILVDLTMHMSDGRPLLFARKPAPIQIAWLAYPGTTGISAIDYRLSDPHLDPPGESENFYSEKTIHLPETFWCYDSLTSEPIPNELPAVKNDRITFGCLNNFCKVTVSTIELWSQALAAAADSHMLILCPLTKQRQVILKEFEQRGIAADRIELVEFQPRRKYLELYHRIDIGLDTIPYNGHTTSLDSLWMGVPVVSRIGRTVVGRAGWSQLSNLNLRELAADSDEQFVRITVGLASDLPRLAELRKTLRRRLEQSPLMDAARFAKNIETAYRETWRDWASRI